MIKKFESEDIAKILKLDHAGANITPLPCDKGQWVQWLMSMAQNEKIRILGEIEDGRVTGYIVLLDNVLPPVFNSCVILYIWSPDNHRTTHALADAAKEWKKEIKADTLAAMVSPDHTDKYMDAFGFKKIAHVYEWRE